MKRRKAHLWVPCVGGKPKWELGLYETSTAALSAANQGWLFSGSNAWTISVKKVWRVLKPQA